MKFWVKKEDFTMQDELLMMETRIVIPKSLRVEMLNKIHQGHLGITKCRARAKQVIW